MCPEFWDISWGAAFCAELYGGLLGKLCGELCAWWLCKTSLNPAFGAIAMICADKSAFIRILGLFSCF